MLVIISYSRATQWKKTCAPLEWEDITGGDLFSTVQSESPAAKCSGLRERRQAVLFIMCWVFTAVHILVSKIWSTRVLPVSSMGQRFSPWPAAAASVNHTALVNWCVPGFAHSSAKTEVGGKHISWVIFLFSQLQVKYNILYLGKGFH